MRGNERDKLGLVIAGLLGAAWGFLSLGKYTAVMEGYGEHSVLGKILVLPAYLSINVLLGGLAWFLETIGAFARSIISAVFVLFAFVLPVVLGGLIAILLYKTFTIIKKQG
ncbi:MAG: hypothetical protein MSIBF_00100 [Candidatus Altiarchaeales archaeon IMC4]|nr:MAG: hypothetical protein MSIBF_00100 [Candidatus Altiarchaeales archaeon IMC4]